MYGMGECAFFAALVAESWTHARAAGARWRARRQREREVAMLEHWFALTVVIHPDSHAPQADR